MIPQQRRAQIRTQNEVRLVFPYNNNFSQAHGRLPSPRDARAFASNPAGAHWPSDEIWGEALGESDSSMASTRYRMAPRTNAAHS